jgi:hypothetical protein
VTRLELAACLAALVAAGCDPAPAAAPPPKAAAAPAATDEGLAWDDVVSVLQREHAKVAGCGILANNPEAGGTIEVAWTIAPSGDVQDAHVASSSLDDKTVTKCVLHYVEHLHFDAATAPTPASWKFRFGHAD